MTSNGTVRALEWESIESTSMWAAQKWAVDPVAWWCYRITLRSDGMHMLRLEWLGNRTEPIGQFFTWEDAQAAAQTNFEDKIMSSLSPPPHVASDVLSGEVAKFWLELREPHCVPERKGPWLATGTASILREFMAARPNALISVVTVSDGVPEFQDGPQCLQMTDGRSMATGRKHIASSNAALASSPSKPEEPVDPKFVKYVATLRHACAYRGPCSDNGDGCTCGAEDLHDRNMRNKSAAPLPVPEPQAVAPIGYVTEEAVVLMQAAKKGWHYHMFAPDQSDPVATMPLYAMPVTVTKEMVEAAAVAVHDIGTRDWDPHRIARAALTAALNLRSI